MAYNNNVGADPAAGGREFLVEAKGYVDGRDRELSLAAVRVEVTGEDGSVVAEMTLPYEPGALRGVPVECLAERLNTRPDYILVV
jgi:hypothetical protein